MDHGILGKPVLALAAVSLIAAPAAASDDTKTGLLAGLGVTAATGKTTLGGGAGAIEAGILSADAFKQSAAIIAGVTHSVVKGERTIALIGADDTLDLISPHIIKGQIKAARDLLAADRTRRCAKLPKPAPVAATPGSAISIKFLGLSGTLGKVTPADAAGVVVTETSIAALELSAADRRLTNALLMSTEVPVLLNGKVPTVLNGEWTPLTATETTAGLKMTVGTEVAGWAEKADQDSTNPSVRTEFDGLVADLNKPGRSCTDAKGAAVQDEQTRDVITSARTLAENLIDAKEGPSVLARAIQAEAYAGSDPVIVRTAIEQVGGTSIARSGVLYTFGWPNAATVSAGLVVSFRVIDPRAATLLAVGEVRCLTGQTNIRKVRDQLRHDPKVKTAPTVCDYRAVSRPGT